MGVLGIASEAKTLERLAEQIEKCGGVVGRGGT